MSHLAYANVKVVKVVVKVEVVRAVAARVEVAWARGVLKNTGVFFEDCGSHTCAPSRAILGRPPPTHVAL